MMRDFNVGVLPVVRQGIPIGVVTDRDLAVRVIAESRDPSKMHVGEAMTSEVFWVYEDEDLDRAIEAMGNWKISRLFVKSHDGKLSGIVSAADIAALSTPERVSDLMRVLGASYWEKHLETVAPAVRGR
jgi:CBS domain-containing protein